MKKLCRSFAIVGVALVALFSIIFSPDLSALDVEFTKQQYNRLTQLARLREQAEDNRDKRARTLERTIKQLIDKVRKRPQRNHEQDIAPFLAALGRLDESMVPALQESLARVPAPDAQVRVSSSWQRDVDRARKTVLSPVQDLLNKSIDAELYDLAHEFFMECLTVYPDNEVLRDKLGHSRVQLEGQYHWLAPHALQRFEEGFLWDQEWGWLPHNKSGGLTQVREKLRQGQWFEEEFGKWISLSDANKMHANVATPWVIRTEHIELTCTLPRREAVQIADKLEQFYRQVFAAYADFFSMRRYGYRLVMGMLEHPPLKVYVYQDRKEYLTAVKDAPEWSAGLFMPRKKSSHFFGSLSKVMYHEFTHQVFHIFAKRNRAPIWVVEGVASYNETPIFDQRGDMRLGVSSASHKLDWYLEQARLGEAMSIDDLFALNHQQWNNTENPGPQYAAAAAVTFFFMESNNRRFRPGFVRYLRDAYLGKARARNIWEYCGMNQQGLYKKWNEWLKEQHAAAKSTNK